MQRTVICKECGLEVPDSFTHPTDATLCIFCALELEEEPELVLEEAEPQLERLEMEEL
jgi:hypothetical protein